jgi:hypothetical protein
MGERIDREFTMAEETGFALQPATDTRARQTVALHRPWTLPPQGLAIFHGDKDPARLSHYFLPRLLLEGKRVLMLDGANCADPRLLERLARQRRVPFEQFSRQLQIARAFTCFQLTELIARVPRLLADFPAEVLIVTAFPELYYDEDVRDWNAQVAFEQALANLRRWACSSDPASAGSPSTAGFPVLNGGRPHPLLSSPDGEGNQGWGAAAGVAREPRLALTVAVFSSTTTFTPSPARRRFFEKVCAAGSEVWQFNSNAEGKLGLVCTKRIFPRNSLSSWGSDPSGSSADGLVKAPSRSTLSPWERARNINTIVDINRQSTIENRQSGDLWVGRFQRFGI